MSYPGGEINVVGTQVLHHADVGDASGKGPHPSRGYLVDVTEIASSESATNLLKCRVVPFDMSNSTDKVRVFECSDHSRGLGRVRGQGLLNQSVDTGSGQLQSGVTVVSRRHGNNAVIQSTIDQFRDRSIDG